MGIIDYLFLECFISRRYCLDSMVEVSGKKVIPSHKTGNEICICNERIGEEGSLVSGWEIFHDLNTDVT